MKEGICFNCNKKENTILNYLEKAKVFAITDALNADNIETID